MSVDVIQPIAKLRLISSLHVLNRNHQHLRFFKLLVVGERKKARILWINRGYPDQVSPARFSSRCWQADERTSRPVAAKATCAGLFICSGLSRPPKIEINPRHRESDPDDNRYQGKSRRWGLHIGTFRKYPLKATSSLSG